MRIDLNHGPQELAENNGTGSTGGAAANVSSSGALGEDQTQLSGVHAQVEALAAQASQLPEVRQERVQALRSAVQSGQYRSNPEEIAGAMFTHMLTVSAA